MKGNVWWWFDHSSNTQTYNFECSIFMPDCWENWSTIWLARSAFLFGSVEEFVGCGTVVGGDWFIFYSMEVTMDIHFNMIYTYRNLSFSSIGQHDMVSDDENTEKRKINVKLRSIQKSNLYPASVDAQVNVRWKQRIGLFAAWSTKIFSSKIQFANGIDTNLL